MIPFPFPVIAQYLGGGKSASSLEHHFRGVRLRAQVARGVGDDPYRISDSEFLGMGDGMLGQRKAKESKYHLGVQAPHARAGKFP